MSTTDTPAAAEAAGTDTPELPLAHRIAEAMAEAGNVTKSDENKEQGYKFASAEAILKAVREPLLSRGILLFPTVDELDEQEIRSRSGTLGTRVVIKVTYRFTDGRETLETSWRGEGQDYGDKAYGKAYTNALKTFIRSAWLLPTEHDDAEGRPPGERVAGAAGNGDAPAWAKAANRGRVGEVGPALVPVLGRARAAGVVRVVRDTYGTFPDGFVAFAKLLAGAYNEALTEAGLFDAVKAERVVLEEQAAKDDAERKAAEEAQAAAEGPDTPAPEATDEPPAEEAHAELDAQAAEAAREEGDPPPASTGPAPGTVAVTIPDGANEEATVRILRGAGCSCEDPLAAGIYEELVKSGAGDSAALDAVKAKVDADCPLVGHGIAF